MELLKPNDDVKNINNFDLEQLKIFAPSSNDQLSENQNILAESDIKALKNFIKKYKKTHGKIIEIDSLLNSNINLKKLCNFKTFEQLTTDYQIYDNLYETDTSFEDISKAFGVSTKFSNYKGNLIETEEIFSISEHEKKTLDILDNSMNNISFDSRNGSSLKLKQKNKSEEIYNYNPKNYNIEFDRIENNPKTTLMIKNIPNKFTKDMLIKMIDKNHKGNYNYFHLPVDSVNNCNMGYAFINFIKNVHIKDFYEEYNNKKWNLFHSEKICEIKYARYQGFDYYKNIKKTSLNLNFYSMNNNN